MNIRSSDTQKAIKLRPSITLEHVNVVLQALHHYAQHTPEIEPNELLAIAESVNIFTREKIKAGTFVPNIKKELTLFKAIEGKIALPSIPVDSDKIPTFSNEQEESDYWNSLNESITSTVEIEKETD